MKGRACLAGPGFRTLILSFSQQTRLASHRIAAHVCTTPVASGLPCCSCHIQLLQASARLHGTAWQHGPAPDLAAGLTFQCPHRPGPEALGTYSGEPNFTPAASMLLWLCLHQDWGLQAVLLLGVLAGPWFGVTRHSTLCVLMRHPTSGRTCPLFLAVAVSN